MSHAPSSSYGQDARQIRGRSLRGSAGNTPLPSTAIRWASGCAFIMLTCTSEPAFAACIEVQKLTASDAVADQEFGVSVSVSGDVAVIGADVDSCAGGFACGAAYVFRFNGSTWAQEQKLTASDEGLDLFGFSVSVSADVALVGAFGEDCAAGLCCGAAYVFRFNGSNWVQEQRLIASDPAMFDNFGFSVSISNNVALIGAFKDDCDVGGDCGSAYVFRFNGSNWVQEQKLTASDPAPGDDFGRSVSLSGEIAVVGANLANCAAGFFCGSAYVFRFSGSTWEQEQKLTAPDAAESDVFGYSVSVSGDVVLVGARLDDCAAGENCGAAYVFRYHPERPSGDRWTPEQKLGASDAAPGDFFGWSVAVSDDAAVVGAPVEDCAVGAACGSAYLFRFTGSQWVQVQKLIASDPSANALLGYSVSTDGGVTLAGAVADDCSEGEWCGSTYLFGVAACSIPATTIWGVAILALLTMAAGSIVIRRREETAAARHWCSTRSRHCPL